MLSVPTRASSAGAVVIVHEAELLSPRQSGGRIRAYCTVHGGDRQRSLSIDAGGDLAGYGYCHACGAKVFVPEMNPDAAMRRGQGGPRERRPISAATLLRPTRVPSAGAPLGVGALGAAWQQSEWKTLHELDARMQARLADDRAKNYLAGRAIPDELATLAGVGYIPADARLGGRLVKWRDRLVFPLGSPAGSGYAGRSLYGWTPGMDENAHKALLEAGNGNGNDASAAADGATDGVGKALRSDPVARRWEKTYPAGWFGYGRMAAAALVVFVEGPFDALALVTAGIDDIPVIALVGTAGRAEWIPPHVRGVLLALDGDGPGRRAAQDLAREIYMAGLDVVTCAPPAEDGSGKDWAERWRLAGIEGVWPVFDALETLETLAAPSRVAVMSATDKTSNYLMLAPSAPVPAPDPTPASDDGLLGVPSPAASIANTSTAPLAAELLAWGEARDWPQLAYAWRTGAGEDHRPYKAIMAGAAGWRRFVAGNTSAELLAAQRAAAVYPAPVTPTPHDPTPSTGTPSTPELAPPASMIAESAPDGPPVQDLPGASVEEPHAGASASEGEARGDLRGDPIGERVELRDWPDCFAALDAGGLWLARVGEHSAAGEAERRELDDLTYPDSVNVAGGASASVSRLLAYMERERITQLWIHPTWAAAAGLPMAPLGEREQLRDGIPHAAFADVAGGTGEPGSWGMGKPGRLRSWLKFYRRGESGTIAISLPHLDGRVPWRQAQDARELLAAILAYREALRRFAYRSGPGASSTSLLRKVHHGSSAALDLTASATPADFPAPARVRAEGKPDIMPQWSWIRERTAEERERGRYVIGLDKNTMFLSACASLRLGLDARPVHLDTADPALASQLAAAVEALTDWHTRPRPKRPVGYWLARVTFPDGLGAPAGAPILSPHPSPLLPHPCYTAPGQADPAASWQWYMSATLELAAEMGAHVEAREAYLWPRESIHEPLEPWYQRLRDARAELMRERADPAGAYPGAALALAAVKATYAQGIGWLDASWLRTSEDAENLYRPDWRHAIHATANANLWRNLARGLDAHTSAQASASASESRCAVSGAPFAILTDAAYYITATPDPLALATELGLRLGTDGGQYKVKLAPFPLDSAELAPVWELMAAGREVGRVASAFASAVNGSEE